MQQPTLILLIHVCVLMSSLWMLYCRCLFIPPEQGEEKAQPSTEKKEQKEKMSVDLISPRAADALLVSALLAVSGAPCTQPEPRFGLYHCCSEGSVSAVLTSLS